MRPKVTTGAALVLVSLATIAARGAWVDAWHRAPLSTTVTTAATTVQATTPSSFSNQTFRLILWTTIGGSQVRVKLTNAFSAAPLSIGAARVALRQSAGAIVPASDRALTFGGSSSATVAAGGEIWSDPATLAVGAHADLAVSVYLPGTFTPTTFHPTALKTSYLSRAGNFVSSGTMPTPLTGPQTTTMAFFVDEVQVDAPAPAAIAALGDSITDGACSNVNANGSWPDLLSKRLTALPDGTPVGVINAGIGSNRFEASDGAGIRGLQRLPGLLGRPGVRWVVILEGVNDMSYENAAAADLIAAYQSAIAQAHAAGVKAYGVPILPVKGGSKDTPAIVATRATVNDWIRTSGAYDAVIDFEPVLRDPADPASMLNSLTCDHTHPNQAGYQAMADAIDLTLFQSPPPVVTPPVFASTPSPLTVAAGQTASFSASATGAPAPTLQWQRAPPAGAFADVAGATGGTYAFAAAVADDGARFRAVASNSTGTVNSPSALLTVVQAPFFTLNPSSQTVSLGQAVSFVSLSTGMPAPAYQWQRAPAAAAFGDIAGATNPAHSLPAVTLADDGAQFRVLAANSTGTAMSGTATLSVIDPVPTGLSAAAVSSGRVDLAWTDNAVGELSQGVYRSLDGSSFLQIATVPANSGSYADASLSPSTLYFYRINVRTPGGDSGFSSVVSTATWAPVPLAPSALAAVAASSTSINLTWTDNASDETGFRVERSSDGVNYALAANLGPNAAGLGDAGLSPATTYFYRARSFNGTGSSAWSAAASAATNAATLGSPPAAPSGLALVQRHSDRIAMRWNDNSSNETAFIIERSLNGVAFSLRATLPAGTTAHTDAGLAPSTNYFYRVKSQNASGASGPSNTLGVKTRPSSVTGVAAQK